MVISGIKKAAIKRKIRSLLESRKPLQQPGKLKSVGIIVDIDQFNAPQDFLNLKKELALEQFKIVEFSNLKKEPLHTESLFFTPRNIGINGGINHPEIKEFLLKKFDLLINYTNKEKPAFNLLTASSNAALKVGISTENASLYDLIIKTDIDDIEGFKSELKKYLRILKMLNNE